MILDRKLADFHSYVGDVSSGEVVACEAVKGAIARHKRDMARQAAKDFPYYFDEDAAQYAIDWFPMTIKHTIGKFASLQFHLEPWQQFGIGSIHGWRRRDDGTRRFRRVFWTMARKNGKSTLTAGMAIHGANFDINPITQQPEAVAQVILAATKREQADKVCFAEVVRMCQQSETLRKRTYKKYNELKFTNNESEIATVGSAKAYDGLNPNVVLLDELHAWGEVHRDFYDTMLTGSGNREQPLLVVTTTAGDDRSYIWLEEYKFSKQVASGDIEDEKLFSFIFELDEDDDPLDESVWAKANPNLGVSVKADYLRDAAKRAAESVLDMHRFKRYHCNLLVDSHERPISMKDWDACQGELSDWRDADAVGAGVDLGSREDLASFALVARFRTDPGGEDDRPTYRYEARQSSYLSRDTTRNLNEAPWAEWVHNDILHVSHSPLDDLTEHLIEECRKWQVDSVAYDPYAGQLFAESVEAEGILVASMAQNQRHFHEPISDLLSSIQLARFRHDGDPLLRWAIGNVVVVKDRQDRWMFDKKTSHDKIDPAVALVMAFRRCSAAAGKCDGSFFMV